MADAERGDDMSETTGGHYLDTGAGPTPLTVASGQIVEAAGQAAYRAYLDHRPDCAACAESPFQCERASELWEAYREARSPR